MTFSSNSYFQEKFTKISSTDQTFKNIRFDECEFTACNLINCRLERCGFTNCKFIDCNLSAIKPANSRFESPKFIRSKVIGFDWPLAAQLDDLNFENCQINYSNFKLLKLPGIIIKDCEAKEVDFSETDLRKGNFRNTDFERTRFFKTNLTEANFKGAKNYSINVRNNILKKTRFSMPEVMMLLNNLDIIIE